MQLFFADDSKQSKLYRPGMGPLVAIGGINVSDNKVCSLEHEINTLCIERYKFPEGVEFKWHPTKDHWMHKNLLGKMREQFYIEMLTLINHNGVKAIVITEDETYPTATNASNALHDATTMFLERVNNELCRMKTDGIVIIDQPGGSQKDQTKFLGGCFKTLLNGTKYVKFDRIALNVLCTPSHFSRLLQAADVVTSCTAQAVAGEATFSLPVFAVIKKMLCSYQGKIGGQGLKIYPDQQYRNLYYHLLGDTPRLDGFLYPYYSNPNVP